MLRIKLVLPEVEKDSYFYQDCKRIQEIFNSKGFYCSMSEAEFVWDALSTEHDASWLTVSQDDIKLWDRLLECQEMFWTVE